MRIVMAGSSGFLGEHLRPALHAAGHELVQLVRREPRTAAEVRWNPAGGELDPALLSDVDAVINLAGANVAGQRWTARYKQVLRTSRVDSTATIARTIAALPAPRRPKALLNASAVGWYGDTGDTPVTEDSPAGEGFFPDLCRVWEAATGPAEEAGVRVVRLRTGFPLASDGGLFRPMLLQFRLFAGGPLGSGRQFVPWLSLADWLSAVRFLLERDDLAGPVNVVGPEPVRYDRLAAVLGRLMHRPSFWPVPGFAMRAVLGELGNEALISQRVLPGVLSAAGFSYAHPDLESALRAALEKTST